MKDLNNLLKEILYPLNQYESGQVSKSYVTLLVASRLDNYRKEIDQHNHKKALWPPALIAIIKRIERAGLHFYIIDNFMKQYFKYQQDAIDDLKKNPNYNKRDLAILEDELKKRMKYYE